MAQDADDARRGLGNHRGAARVARSNQGLGGRCAGRHDRHHPFHQRHRRAPPVGGGRRDPPRVARHPLVAAADRLAGRSRLRGRAASLHAQGRQRIRRARDRGARRTGLTGSRQRHPAQGHHRRCDHLGVLAGYRSNGAARRRDPGRGSPGPPPVAFPRDRADRAARARERHRDECLPGRSRFRRGVVVPSGAARTRDRGAVLHQPERRHPDGAASRRALSRAHLRFGSDQFHARRGVARRLEGGDGGRHRRHHVRRRHADARIPPRGGGVGRHRRRAHQFSHARRARDRARRRQPGARRGRANRPRTRSATNSPAKRSHSAAIF